MSYRRDDFRPAVLALDRACIMMPVSRCEGRLHAHHVITQQELRGNDLAESMWDPSVGAAVCERHHRRHHNRSEPISEMRLPRRCLDFIARHGLDRYLDRYYEA